MKKVLVVFSFLIGMTVQLQAIAGDGVRLLEDFVAKVNSASGRFTQKVIDKQGKQVDSSEGTFAFSRPGKFVWTYDSPYQQKMVCDGTDVWVWDIDLNQVTVRSAKGAIPQSPASVLFGSNSIAKDWNAKDLPEKDGLKWVELTPKSKESNFSKVLFGFQGKVPERMEFTGSLGEKSDLVFKDVEVGVPLKASDFEFVPPKGADVLRTS